MLRPSTEASFKKAKQALMADDKWVTMSETGNFSGNSHFLSGKSEELEIIAYLCVRNNHKKEVNERQNTNNWEPSFSD